MEAKLDAHKAADQERESPTGNPSRFGSCHCLAAMYRCTIGRKCRHLRNEQTPLYCFVMPNDSAHYKLDSEDLNKWTTGIRRDIATLENPPPIIWEKIWKIKLSSRDGSVSSDQSGDNWNLVGRKLVSWKLLFQPTSRYIYR